MIDYKLSEKGVFTKSYFERKICESQIEISKLNGLSTGVFESIRYYNHQALTKSIGNEINNYYGCYEVFLISSDEKVLGLLNCFIDENKLIEIFTSDC